MPPEKGRLVEVASDVFAMINSKDDSVFGGYGANQAFILLENSVLVFDSGLSLLQARNLETKIRSLTDKKIAFLLNSHDHSDHVFGNSFFWKKYSNKGLRIISHVACRDKLELYGTRRLSNYLKIKGMEEYLESVEVREPDLTYPDLGLSLEIEGTKIVLSHPPTGAHTFGDTLLFIPRKGVVFAGDVIWNRFFPNLEDANLEGWINYLEEIDLETYQKVVPGHGDVCGPNRVSEFRSYLKTVRANLLSMNSMKYSDANRYPLKSCFLAAGTDSWKFRLILDHNVNAIFVNKSGT